MRREVEVVCGVEKFANLLPLIFGEGGIIKEAEELAHKTVLAYKGVLIDRKADNGAVKEIYATTDGKFLILIEGREGINIKHVLLKEVVNHIDPLKLESRLRDYNTRNDCPKTKKRFSNYFL